MKREYLKKRNIPRMHPATATPSMMTGTIVAFPYLPASKTKKKSGKSQFLDLQLSVGE
jgi:hypothetical protein